MNQRQPRKLSTDGIDEIGNLLVCCNRRIGAMIQTVSQGVNQFRVISHKTLGSPSQATQ